MSGIYHNATLGVISLSSDGSNWITIADKNLGATQVWNYGDTISEANCGKYYQWGNNYGFPFTGSVTTSTTNVDLSSYGPGNYYSSSVYVVRLYNNPNARGGTTGTNEAKKGPCNTGYHIPAKSERESLYNIFTSLGLSTPLQRAEYLKMPFAGGRDRGSSLGQIFNQWINGRYRSATGYAGGSSYQDGYFLDFNSGNINPGNDGNNSYGHSIRPFKNEAVVPDYTWTKLYGDDIPEPKKLLKRLQNGGNYYYFKEAPTHASAISLNKSSITLTTAGQTYQLTATVSPDDAVEKKVYWSSSDTTIATVSQTGLVTCVTPGSCTITASCDGVSTTCNIGNLFDISISYLIVGGGGGGSSNYAELSYCGASGGGGGGGGAVCTGDLTYCSSTILQITIGAGGAGGNYSSGYQGCSGGGGGATIIGENICANGGCGGGYIQYNRGCWYGGASGSGCGGPSSGYAGTGGGGGGAYGCGGYGCYKGGAGGCGKCGYGFGGGGGAGLCYCTGGATLGGGNGGDGCKDGCNATVCGSGGGGAGIGAENNSCATSVIRKGGDGAGGLALICYQTACEYNLVGGIKYTCGDYTIHCFTENGTLTVG